MLSFYSKIKIEGKKLSFLRTSENKYASQILKWICKFVNVWRDLMFHGICN